MNKFKKELKKNTLFIEGPEELIEFKELLFKNGLDTLMGYDETFKNNNLVNTGYIHYEVLFYLSKKTFDKPVVNLQKFK